MNLRKFIVTKRGTKFRYICNTEFDLYHLAFHISVRERGAVYFGENATVDELIDDLRGNRYRVEEVDE